CQTLKVSPSSIIEKSDTVSCLHPDIAKAVDQLHTTHPHLTFVLFGSRSKGLQKKYSDWDIGFFSMTTAITHQTHLDLLKQVDDLMEDSLETIDLVNLNLADHAFLSDNKYDFIFLTGCLTDWRLLQHKLLSYE
ncbi:MAG TPA: nucleotidyltransferase domain-containing protein, partial [bacterium]|nr:nucleotidyltransferase domain-containing protein [bacterium]